MVINAIVRTNQTTRISSSRAYGDLRLVDRNEAMPGMASILFAYLRGQYIVSLLSFGYEMTWPGQFTDSACSRSRFVIFFETHVSSSSIHKICAIHNIIVVMTGLDNCSQVFYQILKETPEQQ